MTTNEAKLALSAEQIDDCFNQLMLKGSKPDAYRRDLLMSICTQAKLALSASAGGVEEPPYLVSQRKLRTSKTTSLNQMLDHIDHLRASLGAAQGEIAEARKSNETLIAEMQGYSKWAKESTVRAEAALSAQAAAEAEANMLKGKLKDALELVLFNGNATVAAEQRAAGMEQFVDNNMTFYDVDRHTTLDTVNTPVLAAVSGRIWYHATDDQTSYPFSKVIDAALSHPHGEAK